MVSPMPSKETPKLLTVPAVAARLQVNPATVRRWIGDGRLPALRVGRDYRVEPADLDELLRLSRTSTPLTTAGGNQ